MGLPGEVIRLTTEVAREVGLPPALALALVEKESGGQSSAYRAEPKYYDRYIAPKPERWKGSPLWGQRDRWGSYGLTQVLASTAYGQGYPLELDPAQGGTSKAGETWAPLTDPALNLRIGLNYLLTLYLRHGTFRDALAAYNAGSPTSTAGQGYAKDVLEARAARYLRARVV